MTKQKQQLKLLPETTISRGTIRALAEADPQLIRALEITAQLCCLKYSFTQNPVYDLVSDPLNIFDWLISDKNKELKSDILNSRSWWSYKKEEKPYLSVFDILHIIK